MNRRRGLIKKGRHEQPREIFEVSIPLGGKVVIVSLTMVLATIPLLPPISSYFSDYDGKDVSITTPNFYFKVTFESNGGSAIPSIETKSDEPFSAPADPTRQGYTFVSWHAKSDLSDKPWDFATNVMPRQDLTLYAKWSGNSYTITYDLDGGIAVGNPVNYITGIGVFRFNDATKIGHTFEGWYDAKIGGTEITEISTTDFGDKTLYARFTPNSYPITYELDGGVNDVTNPLSYTFGVGVTQFKPATKAGYKFVGWYDASSGGNLVTDISDTATGAQTLYARWLKNIKISFKNFDGSSDVLPEQEVENGATVTIPDAPKQDYHFLGWAEKKSPDKTQSLYLPAGNKAIQKALNPIDQNYLGYSVKSQSEIANITSDKTLYAVYYKQLKATSLADNSAPTAQEFIWNNAIWRVVNTTDLGSKRLSVKVAALTTTEVITTGVNLGTSYWTDLDDTFNINFLDRKYVGGQSDPFFNAAYENGYERSYHKKVIDAYYDALPDQTAVEAVTLNLPDFEEFRDSRTLTQNNFNYSVDYDNWYDAICDRDTGFKTELKGVKQAFALSVDDMYSYMGATYRNQTVVIPLLNFYDTNDPLFSLRSPGSYEVTYSFCQPNIGYNIFDNVEVSPIRPALFLSVDN